MTQRRRTRRTRRGDAVTFGLWAAFWVLLALGVLFAAASIGQARRCAWLTEHQSSNPVGFSTYCEGSR